MKAGSKRTLCAILFVLVCSATAYADSFTFGTIPANGDISGVAGSTVGWGYAITNGSLAKWLEFTGISADPFANGTPNAFIFDFPILAPGDSLNTSYNGFSGLYEFTWDLTAPVGFANSGNFLVSAKWWDGDPFNGGVESTELIDDFTAPYSVTVTPSAVPETSTLLLLGCGLGTLLLVHRR